MRHTHSALATAVAAMLLVVAAPAGATVLHGTAVDPSADSAGVASQDLVGASATYDDTGSFYVSATMAGPIASGPPSTISFTIASFVDPDQCTGPALTAWADTDSFGGSQFSVSDAPHQGWGTTTVTGLSIGLTGSDPILQGETFSCMTVSVRAKGSIAGSLDQLNIPLYFAGTGPDGDYDDVADNVDQCPTVAGVAPTGCPAPQVLRSTRPLQTACAMPKLQGKSLAAAKRAIKLHRGCTLGTVTRPKHGAHLVVRRARKVGTRVNLTLVSHHR
jgi:hypothetical protein